MNGEWNNGSVNARWVRAFLIGLVLGGLAGAAAMLLLAPRAGKRTRAQIRKQGAKLRHQAMDDMDEMVTEAGNKAHEFTESVNKGFDHLQQQAQDALGEIKKK